MNPVAISGAGLGLFRTTLQWKIGRIRYVLCKDILKNLILQDNPLGIDLVVGAKDLLIKFPVFSVQSDAPLM